MSSINLRELLHKSHTIESCIINARIDDGPMY